MSVIWGMRTGGKSFCIALFVLCLAVSCGTGNDERKLSDVKNIADIPLVNSMEQIGFPTSMAVIDEHLMVMSTENQVYLYEDGVQKMKVGSKGNAQFEYLLPWVVRTYGEEIYVWCAMRLKFIVYDLNGLPKGEYPYDSALADFAVRDGVIVIYNSGRNGDRLIDVYDKMSKSVVRSISSSTPEHKELLTLHSVAPFCIGGDKLYFSHKDALTLYSYDWAADKENRISHMESSSFDVERDSSPEDDYIRYNSQVTLLRCSSDGYVILASEGCYTRQDNGRWLKDGRYYSMYSVTEGYGRYVKSFAASSLGDPALFSVYDDELFYIYHEIQGEDCYRLRSISFR